MNVQAILIRISVLAALVGIYFLSEATAGVGIIAIGILFAAWGRIAQAKKHHAEIMTALQKGRVDAA